MSLLQCTCLREEVLLPRVIENRRTTKGHVSQTKGHVSQNIESQCN